MYASNAASSARSATRSNVGRSNARLTARMGDRGLLRQAYVASVGHCNFSPAELVAGVMALGHRAAAGRWGSVAAPASLDRVAAGLGLGPARFIAYHPAPLTGATER